MEGSSSSTTKVGRQQQRELLLQQQGTLILRALSTNSSHETQQQHQSDNLHRQTGDSVPIASLNKNPLKEGKDGAERPFPMNEAFKSSMDGNVVTRPPGSVSYFPDQVAEISYLVAVLEADEEGSYLEDLTGGMDLLATELAPRFFPNAQVREVTASVNGWFPASE
jgi:hypothetical protein